MWQAQVMAARKLSKSGAKIKVGKAFYSFSVFCFLVFCFQFLFVNIILDFFGTKKFNGNVLLTDRSTTKGDKEGLLRGHDDEFGYGCGCFWWYDERQGTRSRKRYMPNRKTIS
jgi:hypothetical protein